MKTFILSALALYLLVFNSSLFGALVSDEQVANALEDLPSHPYLYFDSSERDSIRARIQTDPVARETYQAIKDAADTLMVMPKPPRRPDLVGLSFVYQMTGDSRYAQKVYSLVSKNFGKEIADGFDLDSGRACRSLAIYYDWLYSGLEPEQRVELRAEIMRYINQLRGRYTETWWTHTYRTNWTAVCHGGAGVAALALLAEDPSLVDVITESYNGIWRSYDQIGKDGGWPEGVGYYTYTLFVSTLFSEALQDLSRGRLSLFDHPRLQAVPVDFVLHTLIPPSGRIADATDADWKPVGFNDSSSLKREDNSFGYSILAEATQSGKAAWIRDVLYGDAGSATAFDLIWPKPSVVPLVSANASRYFEDYGVVVMRNDFVSPEKPMLAAISAEHWDPTREMYLLRHIGAEPIPVSTSPWGMEIDTYHHSHGQLNSGSFNVYWQGQAYIDEVEEPGYPSDYWTVNRWQYPYASSLGKNVLVVDGARQVSGKGRGGSVLKFETSQRFDYAVLDATAAYDPVSLNLWKRHIIFDKPETFILLDEIELGSVETFASRMHSSVEIIQVDSHFLLKGEDGLMAVIPLSEEPLELARAKHDLEAVLAGIPESQSRDFTPSIDYMETSAAVSGKDLIIATIILPVADSLSARRIAESAKLTEGDDGHIGVAFTVDGIRSEYTFEKAGNDLRFVLSE